MCRRWLALVIATTLVVSCGEQATDSPTKPDKPQIVVTTNILGDVVTELVGDLAEVSVIMSVGSDPHSFQASAQQVAAMTAAHALIINGAGFEEGLLDPIELATAQGVPTFAAISAVPTLSLKQHSHAHEEHEDHEDHEEESAHSVDPHFFSDPVRMIMTTKAIADFLSQEIPSLETDLFEANTAAYVAELEALNIDIVEILGVIPAEARILITNHEVFAYFAERYDFEVAGTVIPSGSAGGAASARDLTDLGELIEAEGIAAIFTDTSSPGELAETLSAEVDHDVKVVELFTESLGEPGSDGDSYLNMMRSNAERIADALT